MAQLRHELDKRLNRPAFNPQTALGEPDPKFAKGPLGLFADDPVSAAKGAASMPFTAAPDILGMVAEGVNTLGGVVQERLGLPKVGFTPMSGDPIREFIGLDPESPEGIAGEFVSPAGAAVKVVKGLGVVAKSAGPIALALARFKPAKNLTSAQRVIETNFARQLVDNADEMAAQYKALPSTKDGKIISVDDIRELDPTYRSDRSKSAAVHEPASAFSKDLWDAKLAEPGMDDIMLMSGGTGAGKSSGLRLMEPEKYHGIFDSNLSDFDKAKVRIEEALDSGRDVDILHVWRDPLESFSGEGGSAITRAMRNNGNGRTVPIDEHIKTHVGANKTIKELQEFYKNDDRVQIFITDNSLGRENAVLADTSVIQDIDPVRLKEQIIEEARKALESGRLNEKTYQGFIGGT